MLFSNDRHFEGYDAVLLGQNQPSAMNMDSLRDMLSSSEYMAVRESLAEVGFGSGVYYPEDPGLGVVVDLLATFAVQGKDLQPWMRNAQLNRDRNLRLQYLAGMWFNSYLSTTIFQNIISYYRFPGDIFTGSGESIARLQQALFQAGRR
jgi:spermidine synthase